MLTDLRDRLASTVEYRWVNGWAYPLGAWWRDPTILREVGPALANLHKDERVTLVVGIQSRGLIPAAAVAIHLDVGLVQVAKGVQEDERRPPLRGTTGPDYKDRNLVLSLHGWQTPPGSRVLIVDDWIETGAQAKVTKSLVEGAGGVVVGTVVVVDDTDASVRRALNLKSLLRMHDVALR